MAVAVAREDAKRKEKELRGRERVASCLGFRPRCSQAGSCCFWRAGHSGQWVESDSFLGMGFR